MKIITVIGALAGAANVVIHFDNDPAFWGWVSATAWACALLLHEIRYDKY